MKGWDYSLFGGAQDYLGSYTGGSLVGTPDLYNRAAQLRVHQSAGLPESPHFLWMRLPFYALLFKPFTWMSYTTGMVVWKLFSLLLVCGAIWLTPGQKRISAALVCISLPLWATFLLGNDGAVILLAVALFSHYTIAQNDVGAGLVLGALAAAKPQLVPFVLLVHLMERRWRLIEWACLSGGILLAVCFALQGFGWPAQWLNFLATASINSNRRLMPNVSGMFFFADLRYPSVIAGGLALIWFARRPSATEVTARALLYAGAMFAAIAASPHSYIYDYVLPLPLLVSAWRESALAGRWVALFGLPLIYVPIARGLILLGPAVVVMAVCTFLFFMPQKSPVPNPA